MDKSLIKNTGESLDIKAAYIKMQISFELPDDLLESMKDIKDLNGILLLNNNTTVNTENGTQSDQYLLSDNKMYDTSDVVVGVENIREYKLETLNKKPN